MKISEKTVPKGLVTAMLILSFVGFFDAAYLGAEHFSGGIPDCFFQEGCEIVTTGRYSEIGPIPVAYLGLAFYFLVFISMIVYKESGYRKILKYVGYLTFCGFLFSFWLMYAQLFLIGALCVFCVLSALISTALFVLSLAALIQSKWLEYLLE